jgi:hypothetical protein
MLRQVALEAPGAWVLLAFVEAPTQAVREPQQAQLWVRVVAISPSVAHHRRRQQTMSHRVQEAPKEMKGAQQLGLAAQKHAVQEPRVQVAPLSQVVQIQKATLRRHRRPRKARLCQRERQWRVSMQLWEVTVVFVPQI